MAANEILVDLEHCTGCWTCAFSCKFAHGLEDDDWRIVVRTLGSGEGIDKPAGTWGDLHMEWMPVWATKCMRCGANECTESYPEPFCVHNCPTRALSFGDVEDGSTPAGARAAEFKKEGRRFFKMSEFEQARPGITYVNRKR